MPWFSLCHWWNIIKAKIGVGASDEFYRGHENLDDVIGWGTTMKAILLAGGLGARISEETDTKPKPMVEIRDKLLLSLL